MSKSQLIKQYAAKHNLECIDIKAPSNIYDKLASIVKSTKIEPKWQMPDGLHILTKLTAQEQLNNLTREYMHGQAKLNMYEPYSEEWFATLDYTSRLGLDIIEVKEEIERFR